MKECELHKLDSNNIQLTKEKALTTLKVLIKDKQNILKEKDNTEEERQYFNGMLQAYYYCEKIIRCMKEV